MHIFLALDPEKTSLRRQSDERISKVVLPLEEVRKKVAAQAFEDAKTIIGLRECLVYLEAHAVK